MTDVLNINLKISVYDNRLSDRFQLSIYSTGALFRKYFVAMKYR